ncbi:MAG: radical SAM protein [Deltaproteobacteria bacterium]|jgi:MoaA/NifB/PqqE/SkfB family radical SAM enzyme|nr:radical SAM protein [Deltaproteobacteria bacterium]
MALNSVHEDPSGRVALLERDDRYRGLLAEIHGERFTAYREAWEKTGERKDPRDFPLSLDFRVNAGCQLFCVMCPVGKTPLPRENTLMDPGLYADILSQGKENSLPAVTLGMASEPLLHPDPAGLVRIARDAGVMDIRLGTNGLALTPALSDALADSGLARLEVSLDAATPRTYSRVRKGGDFAKVLANVEYFLERGEKRSSKLPLLRLSFLKLPENESELPLFLETWKDRADMLSIQNPVPVGPPARPEPGEEREEEPAAEPLSCPQPWQRLGVLEDGTLWPCCSLLGKDLLRGKNAARESIRDIWKSEAMETLRARLLSPKAPKACRDCFRKPDAESLPRNPAR